MKLKPCRPYTVKSGVWLTKMKKYIALRLVTVWTSQSGRSVCRYGAVEEFGADFASGLLQAKACACVKASEVGFGISSNGLRSFWIEIFHMLFSGGSRNTSVCL